MKILKPIVSLILLAAFVLQVSGKLIVIADYAINKEYVAKMLCVNKNKPQMHCNGKCHMMKQLKAQDKKEQSPANPFKELKDFQPLYGNEINIKLSAVTDSNCLKSTFIYSSLFSTQHLHSVFHPPQA